MSQNQDSTTYARAQPASRKFSALVNKMKKQYEFIKSEQLDQQDFTRSTVRYDLFEKLWNELNDLHYESLDHLDEETAKKNEDIISELDDLYIEGLSLLRIHIDEKRPITNLNQDEGASSGSVDGNVPRPLQVEVKLPVQQNIQNTWGHFSGDLTKWKGFRDRFVAAVHENNDIKPAFKYQHLRKSLSGSALGTVGSGSGTEDADSYERAWDRLNEVFNCPYAICRAHIHKLLQMPTLVEPVTAEQLQALSNNTHDQLRQLQGHNIPIQGWDMMICTLLHDRLPNELARQWDLTRATETPTAVQMLEFLDKQAKALLNVTESTVQPGAKEHVQAAIRKYHANREKANQNKESDKGKSTSHSKKPHYPCQACSQDHPLYMCPEFLSLNYNGRWDFVRRRGICANCLRIGHSVQNCLYVKCSDPRCASDRKHNSTLCAHKLQNQSKMVAVASTSKRSS